MCLSKNCLTLRTKIIELYIYLSSIVDRNSRFPKILDYFTFSNFRLFHETSALIFFAKLWNKKCKHFSKKGGEIITYNAELCTEVFSAITCCSYGFREIIFSRNFAKPIFAKTIISKFRIVFTKKCEMSGKNERNTNEIFRIFSRKFSFAGNPMSELKYAILSWNKIKGWTT